MRNKLSCASYIFFAAALTAGIACGGETQTSQLIAQDRPGDFQYKTEPGDPSKGEVERNLTIYRPTQQVVYISTTYTDGRFVEQQFRIGINPSIERETEFHPHPSGDGSHYKRRETLYDSQGRLDVTLFYRPDGSLEQQLSPAGPADVTHGTPDIGTTPVIPEPDDPTQPLPKPKPDPDKMPQPKPGPDIKEYPPYPDGAPCVGIPQDPCKTPDKQTNPCWPSRRRELRYPDGTLCIGELKDPSKRPDKATNPCICNSGPTPYLPPKPDPDKKPK